MFIQTEQTPNPLTLKFLPGRIVIKEGTAFYKIKSEALNSNLAKKIFTIKGLSSVFFGTDFITVTKIEDLVWQTLKSTILGAIMDYYDSVEDTILETSKIKPSDSKNENPNDTDIVKQIKELLNTRVRPAVAMDGGDIVYKSFEKGIVYLHMQGSCAGCPSSTATLKMGIENMLKHYIPEVKEVQPIDA